LNVVFKKYYFSVWLYSRYFCV